MGKAQNGLLEQDSVESLVDAWEKISRVLDVSAGAEALAEIVEIARNVTRTDSAQIFLLGGDKRTLTLVADTHEPEKVGRVSIRVGEGLTGWAAEHRKPVAIHKEPWKDPRFLEYPGLDEKAFQSLLCVPLVTQGELLGVVNVRTYRAYGYTASEAKILSRIAEQVARAIGYYSRVANLETHANRFEAISEVTSLISASPYLEEILQLVVSFTAERFGYKVVTVRLLDKLRGELVLRATQSTNYSYRRKRSLKVGESFAGRAVLEKKSITTEDVLNDPEYIGVELAVEQGLRSMVCVPLSIRDDVIGVMTCYSDEVRQFSNAEIKALEALARQAAIAIEHAKLRVRTTLTQELHHRVKNNLQQIVSLLRLQLLENEHRSVREVIQESLNRIFAISSVHDLLSREDLDRVGLLEIAQSLANHHQQALVPDMSVKISVSGDNVPLSLDQATQIALILNELLHNAFEHGFKQEKNGEVHVVILSKDNQVSLWVSNSGNQLSPNFQLELDSHLGLKIVENLARAIGGKFNLRNSYGWVVAEIHFPRDEMELG